MKETILSVDTYTNLRTLRASDLDSLITYYGNKKIRRFSPDFFGNFNREDWLKFIFSTRKPKRTQIFGIEHNGEIIGINGILLQRDIYRKNAELFSWIGEPFWRKGIAFESMLVLIDHAFETWDLRRLYARTFGSNHKAIQGVKKLGFTLDARIEKSFFVEGKYEDELIFGHVKENA